jgi:hypothetical protein
MSKKSRRVQFIAPPELFELAEVIGQTPTVILEQFIKDLLRLPGSSGSDERDKAGEYFLRTNIVGIDQQDAASEFISIGREEYRCQICKQWVRASELRYRFKPEPHFVCWGHPEQESSTVEKHS